MRRRLLGGQDRSWGSDDQSSLARCNYKGYCHVQVSRRAKKGKPDVDSCSLFDFETDSDS